jgi:epoxyqueuosine reductase
MPHAAQSGGSVFMKTGGDCAWIAERAKALGFERCGLVRAEQFPELLKTEEWLKRGYAGEMKYLADPRRSDPRTAMPGVQSIIVCLLNYNTANPLTRDGVGEKEKEYPRGWISRYAWGDDYHEVMREKLNALAEALRDRWGNSFESRVYADTGPVQERVLAKYAGLGWLGKNTLLLNQELGSYFFLGVILTSLDLEPTLGSREAPPPDLCGSCTRCLDACPTDAFTEAYVMDARKCISYLTIELRGAIPEELRAGMGEHVFGCDICQDVCPWNRKAPVTKLMEFAPRSFQPHEAHEESLLRPRLEWLLDLDEKKFREVFQGSAVKRTKWRGLLRNACIAIGNAGTTTANRERIAATLKRLAASEDRVIAESAQWALSRI